MRIDIAKLSGSIVVEIPLTANISETRAFGDAWLVSRSGAVLGVSSVLAPRGTNYLINPLHPDAKEAVIPEITDFKFDGRLWADTVEKRF